jgi:tetratricopeptide (TPR) repeat protein
MNAPVNARRNDPCPCGSGLKFKNCHGDLTGAPGSSAASAAVASPASAASASPAIDRALEQAMQRHQAGDLAGAEAAYRAILVQSPDSPVPMHFLGVALWQRNQAEHALPLIEGSLRLENSIADFHNNHALVLKTLGRRDEAIAACRRALVIQAENVSALNTLGMLFVDAGTPQEAVGCFEEALRVYPDFLEARINLSQAFFQSGKHAQALEQAELALAVAPDQVDALMSKAQALHKLSRYTQALQVFDRILALQPQDTRALNGKAAALFDEGTTDAAESAANQALAIDANYGPAHLTLGNVGHRKGDTRRALECYLEAERLAARNESQSGKALAEARTNIGIASLALGEWSRAWSAYSWKVHRDLADRDPNDPGHPKPLPDDLSGKTLIVRGEQGLGDVLFFLRFCGPLTARGASVIYRGDSRLAPLLQRSGVFIRCIPDHEPGPAHGLQAWAGDLPFLLGAPAPIDCPPLKLDADPSHLSAVRSRLHALGPAPYVALTWRAGTQSLLDNNPTLFKAIDLQGLANGLRGVEGTLISVQRHPKAGETESLSTLLGRKVHDWSGANEDLEEMLAVMELVDEYIGVSNTNMHLRAGVGRGAKVLVPQPPEWRWMAEGDQSPWFPGIKVLRQQVNGSWQAAFNAL